MPPSNRIIALVIVLLVVPVPIAHASPRVLLYHSFDKGLANPDYSTAPVRVKVQGDVKLRPDGIYGAAAQFDADAAESSLRIDLGDLGSASSGTLALWNILDVKEALTAPTENLATMLDADGKPIFKINKSGHVLVYEDDNEVEMPCFDALWWLMYSREHLAITWETGTSGVGTHSGIVKIYWKARPYGALVIELNRKPAELVIGQGGAGISADELYLFDEALPLRAIWELTRQQPDSIDKLESAIAARCEIETKRPTTVLRAAWDRAAASGILVEAETSKGIETKQSPAEHEGRIQAANAGNTASGRAYVNPKKETLTLKVDVPEAGRYALALRYCMDRMIQALWPQNSTTKTPWTDNYASIEVLVDGKAVAGDGIEKLYPTGGYDGHRGDVTIWAWHAVAGGKKLRLDAGEHTVQVSFKKGLANPAYDALLLTQEPGPIVKYPRWADQYRIPPAWWIVDHDRKIAGQLRVDTYTVALRNRTDEPYSCELVVGPDKLAKQQVSADVSRISLKPFEEKTFKVTFNIPADMTGISEWANVYLWNEDVPLRQKYRLWNVIPPAEYESKVHPILVGVPDKDKQAQLAAWLEHRAPNAMTKELRTWTRGRRQTLGGGLGAIKVFQKPLLDRLEALDAWMAMSAEEIDEYLPDGPAENNGYGTGWERTGIEYSGRWSKTPKVTKLDPGGDIDYVTSVTVEAPDWEDKTKLYRKVYTDAADVDIIACARDVRWQSMVGKLRYGGSPYKDTPLGVQDHAGIPLLAEAYYLTGDRKYADKAYQMLHIFARKYTYLTRHSWFNLHREDRDWWGARTNGRYQTKYGMRTYQGLGTYVLDMIWDALTPQQRTEIEHNVIRWGVYEGMAGPLMESPAYMAAGSREDMPYVEMGRVLGDVGPDKGLRFFYDLYRADVLPDGMHQCSTGTYGGVKRYVTYMLKLQKMGLDVVTGNEALKNCFLTFPRFIFSGGGMPNIDDGGGVGLQGLGAGFGCPTAAQYAWAEKTYKDPIYGKMQKFIGDTRTTTDAPTQKRMETLRKVYLSSGHDVDELWANTFVIPVKGMAMLRNRVPAEPIDWVEVIFDYGKMGGRAHGHPAKLATVPSLNGQITSMEYGYGWHGKPISHGFHMQSYAHNVVVADGKSQRHATGTIQIGNFRESYGAKDVQWIDADSTRIYKGIYMRRTVFTTPFGIVDLHLCASDAEHTYDWMYHSFGVPESTGSPEPVDKLADSGPLTFAVNPRQYDSDGLVQVTWVNAPRSKPLKKDSSALLDEKTSIRLWSLPVKGTSVWLFTIPINVEHNGMAIDYAMLRRKANSTVFATVQEPWRESTGAKVKSIRALPVTAGGQTVLQTQACALEVTLTDGGRHVFFVNYSGGEKTVAGVTTDANVATWAIAPLPDAKVTDIHHSEGAALKVR